MFCMVLALVFAHSFAEGAWLSQSCQISEWGAWTSLGNGTSTRARVILRYPTGSEPPCPPLTESKTDCEVSIWTEWKIWGNGSLTRSRVITRNPTGSGTPCPPLTETKVDCGVSPWSEWKTSGNGSSSRTRVIIRSPTGNGTPCPSLTETKVDCNVSLWTEWSPSGNGSSTRTRVITRSPTKNGLPCPPLTETKVDCNVSVWAEWKPSANGSSTRTRVITRYPTSNGTPCPPLTETKVDCNVSVWTEWKPSSNGNWTRTRNILRSPTANGTPCLPLTETRADCEVSEWSDWIYVQGPISRSRTVINRLTPQSSCPILSETLNTTILRQNTSATGARFANTFMGYGFVKSTSKLTKRQIPDSGKFRDLLVILDSSGSIGDSSYSTAKTELGKLLALLCPRPNPFDTNYQQVAMITFSSTTIEIFDFKAYRNVQAIQNAINRAVYQDGGTCTEKAFKLAIDMFTVGKGARIGQTGVKQEVLIITDGDSNCGPGLATAAARQLRNTGVDVYGLMVGNFVGAGIAEVASYVSYGTTDHLFQIRGGFLELPAFVRAVENEMAINNVPCAPFNFQ